jgi:phosphoglycolate phosphatase-like HAD superfamily hydrolase
VAILEVLNEWGLIPGEAIYIGDAPTDVLVARKVGCCVALVCRAGPAQANVLEPLHPDTVVHTVNELKEWLLPKLVTSL